MPKSATILPRFSPFKTQGSNATRLRQLTSAMMSVHTLESASCLPWLWRGVANGFFGVKPSAHTRLALSYNKLSDDMIVEYTETLLREARGRGFDSPDGFRLTDLGLLAYLQHHMAATPLLDVSLDPLVALQFASLGDLDKIGYVHAIPHPIYFDTNGKFPSGKANMDGSTITFDKLSQYVIQFSCDADISFAEAYEFAIRLRDNPPEIGFPLILVEMPIVSSRIIAQRAYCLLGAFQNIDNDPLNKRSSTIPLGNFDAQWIKGAMRYTTGKPGAQERPENRRTGIAFEVTTSIKRENKLQNWVTIRSGLSPVSLYPAMDKNRHVEAWCSARGRSERCW